MLSGKSVSGDKIRSRSGIEDIFSLAIGGKTNTPALCYLLNAVCWLVGCPVTVDPKIVAPLRFTSHRLHFISTDRIQDNN